MKSETPELRGKRELLTKKGKGANGETKASEKRTEEKKDNEPEARRWIKGGK